MLGFTFSLDDLGESLGVLLLHGRESSEGSFVEDSLGELGSGVNVTKS